MDILDNNNIIYVENVTKKFPKGTIALSGVNLAIEKGSFTAVMGASGSGKSTLMNIIGALDKPTEGRVYVEGQCITELDDEAASVFRMKKMGFVFQNFLLNPYLTSYDNILLPTLINKDFDAANKDVIIDELLEKFGVYECKDKLPKEMSGGEQQRVAIARALVNSPEIIMADEPTGNLDEDNEIIVFDYLKELTREGKTVLVISHNDAVKNYADKVIYINKGKIKEKND